MTDQAIWAWVQIPTLSTYLLEDEQLAQTTMAHASALAALLPERAEWHLKIIWDRHRGTEYLASWEGVDSVRAPRADAYLALGAHRIDRNAEVGYFRRRVVLLGVRWPETRPTGQHGLPRDLNPEPDPRHALQRAHKRLAEVEQAIGRWHRQMEASVLHAHPASASRIAWSYARELRRDIGLTLPEQQLLSGGALVSIAEGRMDPTRSEDYVVVTDRATGESRYVSVLCSATNGFPVAELSLPGGEWLGMILNDVPDVDVSVRGVHYGPSGSVELLGQARDVVRSQRREAAAVGEDPLEAAEAEAALVARRQEAQRRLDVQITCHPRWVVSAESPAELEERVSQLTKTYVGTVELHRPRAIQDLLWMELLPGDQSRVPEFAQEQPMRTLVGGWPHGGSTVGDATGPYLGENLGASPGPVQAHLVSRQGEHRTQPTTIAVTGRSGEGKSTLVMMLLLGALTEGAWALLVDPKGDLSGIVAVARDVLGVDVQVMRVMDPRCSGMMDPMRTARSADEARRFTLDALLGALSPGDRARGENVLENAVDAVLQRPPETWSSPAVIGELIAASGGDLAARTAHELGETLRLRARQPSMRAVLGPAAPDSVALMTGRGLVYLDLSGLDLPRHSPDPERWSVPERCAMATFHVALAYASVQGQRIRELKKVVAIAELHLITSYPAGEALVSWVARTGRANQLYLLLDTHVAADLLRVQGLAEQIVMAFSFAASGQSEQDAQAELLRRAESGPRIRAALSSLATGECIIRDRRGNLAPLYVDRLSLPIARALSTTAGDDRPDLIDDPPGAMANEG
ncbi:ATP-binding protein [Crossiella sp. SN42]|uniref:ATP-binding protein n=1 Tax=Crossiella sp. SN42 TaxID=2944808 RepID=UPI00207C42CC|nr:ATP-binding protein [Crossiella sp. SN42]MCO1575581.1 ATP-binding protein [Crossiella sp. SN42]